MNANPPNSKKPIPLKNWLSVSGLIIGTGGLFAFVFLFAIDQISHHGNPYMGILAYVVAPSFILLGIALTAVGAWRHHRALRDFDPKAASHELTIDLTRSRDRKIATIFTAGAAIFLMLTAFGSYQTYHYTESVQFCGQTCHTPMKPEFTAYLNSSHARVDCVACHVGEGAEAYVKAKINGVHQLKGVITGDYHRPIKAPVRNLRPARETCEECHWPEKFTGNLDRSYTHFLADETNTAFTVRLLLKVGGASAAHGEQGIHWHVNPANKVEYLAGDAQRQTMSWVRYTDAAGNVTEYRAPDFKGDINPSEVRRMDCIDCHNRPGHNFKAPNDLVDKAMASGRIDPSLTWVKSNVVAALVAPYQNETEALEKITGYLKARYPKEPKIEGVIRVAHELYKTNFFPEMKADWRAYPNNIGHKEWNGCFRCHDGNHKTADAKKSISANNCNSCHTILAQGAGADLEKLNAKGHSFFHIDSVNEDFSCATCHTGAFPKE
jgi:nitrate/TMAO reductase-like tetraheme cytochrome c subunit